jgi:serine/threonine protein kinase
MNKYFSNNHIDRTIIDCSPYCKDLLKKMLNPNAKQRPDASDCLQHDWFKDDREALKNILSINKSSISSFQWLSASIYDDGKQANTPLYFESLKKNFEN